MSAAAAEVARPLLCVVKNAAEAEVVPSRNLFV